MLIGMFHIRKDPNKVSRAYLYSAIARQEGHEFFYFTARGVNFEKRKILGKHYQNGKWKTKIFPFPDVIINAANQDSAFQDETENRLKTLIPFTSYPVGTKTNVYSKIIAGEIFKAHVIPYDFIEQSADVFEFMKTHGKIVIKPVRGHHGEDVISIEKKGRRYLVHLGKKNLFFQKQKLIAFIDKMLVKRRMLMQKFIDCRLRSGAPYDFRLHLQKNRFGKWVITIIFPRVGTIDRVITNLSQGTQMVVLRFFLQKEFGEEAPTIQKLLSDFALSFVEHFESLYPHKFDELALDVGLDSDKHIWIYEVNWRPGHVFIEVQTAKNAIDYAIYLAEKNREINEKAGTERN
ncbi:MAG TPA: YheC/YheD family protein [Acholeplasmataceae bacterium]|nr:YheC/YheD family protein [Acholeplasmataceae bacterium]